MPVLSDRESEQLRAFFAALFRGRGHGQVFVTSLASSARRRLVAPVEELVTFEGLKAFVETREVPGHHLYYCVSSLKPEAKKGRHQSLRHSGNLHRLGALFAEIDFHSVEMPAGEVSVQWVQGRLNRLLYPPSMMVMSGHGIHAYWLLEQPMTDMGMAKELLQALTRITAGDPASAEPARLLRIPLTTNWKNEGEPVKTQFLKLSSQRTVIADLMGWLDDAEPVMHEKEEERAAPHWTRQNSYNPFDLINWREPVDAGSRLLDMRYHGAGDTAIHITQLATTASMLNTGIARDEVVQWVLKATMQLAPPDERWSEAAERRNLERMCDTWLARLAQEAREGISVIPSREGITGNGHDTAPPPSFKETTETTETTQPAVPEFPTQWETSTGADIAPRQWLYGGHYVRGFVGCTIGLPGVGKSSLSMAECLAMATGRSLLGVPGSDPLSVWYHNAEDPYVELNRRLAGIVKHHGITAEEIAGNLRVSSGREFPLVLAYLGVKGKAVRNEKHIALIKAAITRHHIDVWSFGPLTGMHEVTENDNTQMNVLIRILNEIAEECQCAIDFEHHSRKVGNSEDGVTIDSTRGASSIIGAVRSARTLNAMTTEEGEKLDVNEHVRQHFRLENPRNSMHPALDDAHWFKLISVEIDNGESIGVATAWEATGVMEDITPGMVQVALDFLRGGGDWRWSPQSPAWVGHAIAGALGLDAKDGHGKWRLKKILDQWRRDKLIRVVPRYDAQRKQTVEFVEAMP